MAAIRRSGRIVFHIVGDTGGVRAPQAQQIVAMHMEREFNVAGAAARPAFLYILGDVVYYYGEAREYYPQFYEPYVHYPAPIFAIPGNHDGDVHDPTVPSLAAFVENFCAAHPRRTPEAGDVARDAMTLPNVYWTLEAPFVTIIGLYTNVPEGGELDHEQASWLESELRTAPTEQALLVTMHHPIYSADVMHSGSHYMAALLDRATARAGRRPDAVLAGHVHNYQRFTRAVDDRQVPYILAGAGGYWRLHYVQQPVGGPLPQPFPVPGTDATLERYVDDRHGYLRLEVTAETLTGDYFTVPRPQEHWRGPAVRFDTFTLDLQRHQLRT